MTKILTIQISVLLLIVMGCKKENPIDNKTQQQLPDTIAGYVSINYQHIATAPFYIQTTMLTSYNGKLYRIGGSWPTQVLDISTNTWTPITITDSTVWRWDGAAVTMGDSIYILATYYNTSYDIIVLDASKNIFKHTGANLPPEFSYPVVCTYNDKILFLTAQYDSVFEYNTLNRKLRIVAGNPFKRSDRNYRFLASGKYSNYLYVFGGYYLLPDNKFYRFNLDTYTWEEIGIPSVLQQRINFGASYGNQFILFSDSLTTHLYLFDQKKWYRDTAKVPIYPRDLTGKLFLGEWSFVAGDSCLYGTETREHKIWKITSSKFKSN